jgi:replicative DNA helicase
MANKKLKKLYYDNRNGFQVLGCLMRNPSLIKDKKYKLSTIDFSEPLHKYIFSAIYNLVIQNLAQITPIEIETYLSNTSPKHHKIVFEDNDGFEWLDNATNPEMVKLTNFDFNYNKLKKFTLLRNYIDEGFDVSEILDQTELDVGNIEGQNEAFNEMTIEDITKYFDKKILNVKSKINSQDGEAYRVAGDNSMAIKERLKKESPYGLMSNSGYWNAVTRGMQRGKFFIESGSSGTGKTRSALSKLVYACATELWDYDLERFVPNPNNPDGELSGVYLGTEMDLENEVEVIMWAIISGVPTERIVENTYEDGEEERVDYAIEVLSRSKIHLYDDSNYGISTLESICEKHVTEDENLFGLFLDYIDLTSEVMTEFSATRKGTPSREDVAYRWLSTECKRIAKKYDIYFGSSTQLNAKSTENDKEKNGGMIRGSFSLSDKADLGLIFAMPNAKELERVDDIIKKIGGFGKPKPNRVEHIYKSRGTKHKEIRIFQHVDLGTMRITDLFVTDYDFKQIDINPKYAE